MFILALAACALIHQADLLEGKLTLLFPSPVKRFHLKDHVEDYAALLASLHDTINASWSEHVAGRKAGSRGFQENDDFFDFQRDEYGETHSERGWLAGDAGRRFLSMIVNVAEAYLRDLHLDRLPALQAGDFHVWASVHHACSLHPVHVHPGATLSGVLYVATEPDGGQLVFTDPRGALPPFDDHRLGFRPAPGDMLIFPPWLPHEVTSSARCGLTASDAPPRVSISFNLLADRADEQPNWGRSTAHFRHAAHTAGDWYEPTCSKSIGEPAGTTIGWLAEGIGTESDVGAIAQRLVGMRAELVQLAQIARRLQSGDAGAEPEQALRQRAPRAQLSTAQQALEGILTESATLLERLLGSKVSIEVED
jgi:uncharacterized protein (TIGR02466 family)